MATMVEEDDEYFFVLTDNEFAELIHIELKKAGITADELLAQANLGRFDTHRLHNLSMATRSGLRDPDIYAMIKDLEKKDNETRK